METSTANEVWRSTNQLGENLLLIYLLTAIFVVTILCSQVKSTSKFPLKKDMQCSLL